MYYLTSYVINIDSEIGNHDGSYKNEKKSYPSQVYPLSFANYNF